VRAGKRYDKHPGRSEGPAHSDIPFPGETREEKKKYGFLFSIPLTERAGNREKRNP
jgi:hypothetical protein